MPRLQVRVTEETELILKRLVGEKGQLSDLLEDMVKVYVDKRALTPVAPKKTHETVVKRTGRAAEEPLQWRESDFTDNRWDGSASARDRAVVFPIGNAINTTEGLVSRPWWIPGKYSGHVPEWEGFKLHVSRELEEDWAGNGCQFNPNRRLEPALKGDVQVWYTVTDVEKAWASLESNGTVPCYLHVDVTRYNADKKYQYLCDKYIDKFINDFELSVEAWRKNRSK